MAKSDYELNKKIVDVLEQNEIGLCSIDKHDGEYDTELEWYSPAGEDFIITFYFDGTPGDFVNQFREYACDFDPDEHAESWVEFRGEGGCPSSIRELIEDADAIKEFLMTVRLELGAIEFDEDDG